MTTDFRALCAELAEQLDDSLDFTVSGETRRHMKLLTRRARAALADEPAVPAPPADGEVAELVADLQQQANHGFSEFISRDDLLRAAELLQRQALVPVAVSERLPGPEDCDAEGRCWWGAPRSGAADAGWIHRTPSERLSHQTHWLPAHALPLPEVGE